MYCFNVITDRLQTKFRIKIKAILLNVTTVLPNQAKEYSKHRLSDKELFNTLKKLVQKAQQGCVNTMESETNHIPLLSHQKLLRIQVPD